MDYKADIQKLQLHTVASQNKFKAYSHRRWYSQSFFRKLYNNNPNHNNLPDFINIIYKSGVVAINLNTHGAEFNNETIDNIEAWQHIKETPAPSDAQLKVRHAGRCIWSHAGLVRNLQLLVNDYTKYISSYGEGHSVEETVLFRLQYHLEQLQNIDHELRLALRIKPAGRGATLGDIIAKAVKRAANGY